MSSKDEELRSAVDSVLSTLPPVWDRLRSKLRAAAMSKFDITLDQFHTLRHIRQGYGTVGALAEKRQVSRAAISQSVAALVRKKLVTRARDGDDRRRVALGLTPYARKVLDENYEDNRAWARERMASLKVSELVELRRAMATLQGLFAPEARGSS